MVAAKKPRAPAKKTRPDGKSPAPGQVIEDAVVVDEVVGVNWAAAILIGKTAIPLVIGGVVAGAIGFGVATLLWEAPAPVVVDNSAAEQMVALKSEIAGLKFQLSDLKQVVADGPTSVVINGLGKRQDRADRLGVAQAGDIEQLAARLTDLENRPAPLPGAGSDNSAQIEAELASIRDDLATEMQRIEAAQAKLGTAKAASETQAEGVSAALAYAEVVRAVNAGGAFDVALAQLAENGSDIPVALSQSAADGVITLAQLQAEFPAYARTALNAATRAAVEQGEGSRLGAFLRIQLGARSLEPKDGDDANAVLSRAEAALKGDDIAAAIAEIESLTEAGAGEMAGWVDLARSRLRVLDALAELSAAVRN